ncbi:MAG: aminotransferase class V-fold PLP-dependent enzyme [Gemmatimonadota bacterium]
MATPAANLPTAAALSRRRFLSRGAAASLGLAALPGLGGAAGALRAAPPRGTTAAPALRPPPARAPDEAYWELVRAQFPLREGVIPMNAANLCPAPRQVIDAVAAAMRDVDGDVSFQNRGKYGDLLEATRARLAAYLGADADEIAIVRNTSEANNIIVGGLELGPGDEVLLLDQNHPTNNVAWDVRAARFGFSVRRIPVPPTLPTPAAVLDAFLSELRPATRVLAFTDVSNTTGLRMPSAALCAAARERGVYTHADGAQTFGALVRDLHAMGCDSYAASAHKWFMGPDEAGVLYVRRERIETIWPGMVGVGWGNGAATSARGARKFETLGQRNDATIAGFAAAVAFHETIGPAVVEARVLELATALRAAIAALPGATLITPAPAEMRAGVVIASFAGADAGALYRRLYEEHGVAGASTGGMRLCPHIYNTLADVERAAAAVGRVAAEARGGPR